jgi:hypothetical protein
LLPLRCIFNVRNIISIYSQSNSITALSEIVEEIFRPDVEISPVRTTEAQKFTTTITAPQFCEGLLRISMHELYKRKSDKVDAARQGKSLEKKIRNLLQFKVLIVPTIVSQFNDIRTKQNVTKDSEGVYYSYYR